MNQEKKTENTAESKIDVKKPFQAISFLGIGIDFGLLVFIPLLSLTWVGRWLDERYGGERYVIIGILLALTISAVAIGRYIKKLSNSIKKR